ncbi:hypothetical protein GCM10009000_063660 [Halobacterium noricense]|uniref:Uncharacterized protein n=1 Tax=Haladaptatus pallidirubidus TaxID=1008152 RepID=A0AAV3UJW3_9EURY
MIRTTDTSHLRYLLDSEPLIKAARDRDDMRLAHDSVTISSSGGEFDDTNSVNVTQYDKK